MKNFLIPILILFWLPVTGLPSPPSVTVDRIEGPHAVLEIARQDRVKILRVDIDDLNEPVAEGDRIPYRELRGTFRSAIEPVDNTRGVWYQFVSEDETSFWLLTEEEIGGIPSFGCEYVLMFFDNGTDEGNKECGCKAECECWKYDDIFLDIVKAPRIA